MRFSVTVVMLVRVGVFLASQVGLPPYAAPAVGALVLLGHNALRPVTSAGRALSQAPWAIMAFAFGMDLVVFGLRGAGVTELLAGWLGPQVRADVLAASILPGSLAALVSVLLNNHPGLIISALTLEQISSLSDLGLRLAYASIIVGSDIAALLTPVGTLASLIWFHVLRHHGLRYSWTEYLKVTVVVLPLSVAVGLMSLFASAVVFLAR